MSDSKIRVAVRVRPLSRNEINDGANIITQIINDTSVSIDGMSTNFKCDYAFGMDSTQLNVYNKMCNGIVDKLFEGYNSTIFAYGQTGSGKTHTMGSASCINESDYGISHLTIQDIFKKKSDLEKNGATVNIEVSYVEVYLEDSFDLLSGPKYGGNIRSQVEIKENKNGETYLDGLKSIPVKNIEEVLLCLEDASTKRSTGSTSMNATSSRSHAICTLSMKTTKASNSDSIFNTVISKLHLVDLAGSERVKKTQATGDRLNEGININKGLSILGRVVTALQTQQSHIPYRESKLTRILKDSLGGNSCTVMLACISPSNMNKDESISTLRFAECAGSIVNKASINTHYDEEYTKNNESLVKEISMLKQQNINLQQQNYTLQNNLGSLSKSSSNIVKSITNNDIIAGSVLLAGVIRSLLVKCLEEGADVDEDEVISIRSDISAMRTGIGSVITIDTNEDDDKNGFMPPLFKLVEEIEVLEKELSIMIDPTKSNDDDNNENDNDENCNSLLDENDINENIFNDNVTKDTESLQNKQNELNTYQSTINLLKTEIQSLSADKNRLQKQQNHNPLSNNGFGNPRSHTDVALIKKQLFEKSKLLEEKKKLLLQKEHGKEKAEKEAEILRKQVEESKIKRVQLQKRIKEEGKDHLVEKKKLEKEQMQSKKREITVLDQLSRLQDAQRKNENVMRAKFEQKERESQYLKQLIVKQTNAKQMREQNKIGLCQSNNSFTSNTLSNNTTSSLQSSVSAPALSASRQMELEKWITKETEEELTRNNIKDELQNLIEKRSTSNIPEEVRKYTQDIGRLQGQLADLGSIIEKRRFGSISDVKEAKMLLSWLFSKATKDKEKSKLLVKERTKLPNSSLPVWGSNVNKTKSLQQKDKITEKNKNNSDKNKENNEDDSDEWDELDESLYEEEDDDDDDYDYDYEIKNNRNKRTKNKRRNSDNDNNSIDRDDNNISLDSGRSSESSRNKKSKKTENYDNVPLLPNIILESLSKNTNDQLKDYLRSYGLTVSGNKAALILRLEEYHQKRNHVGEVNNDMNESMNESMNFSISEEEMNAQMLLVVDEIKCDIDTISVVEIVPVEKQLIEEPTTPQVDLPKVTASSLLNRINAKRKALGDITNNINDDDVCKENLLPNNEVNKITITNNVKKQSLFSQKISMAAKSTINIIEDKKNTETSKLTSIIDEFDNNETININEIIPVKEQPPGFRKLVDPNRKLNSLGGTYKAFGLPALYMLPDEK